MGFRTSEGRRTGFRSSRRQASARRSATACVCGRDGTGREHGGADPLDRARRGAVCRLRHLLEVLPDQVDPCAGGRMRSTRRPASTAGLHPRVPYDAVRSRTSSTSTSSASSTRWRSVLDPLHAVRPRRDAVAGRRRLMAIGFDAFHDARSCARWSAGRSTPTFRMPRAVAQDLVTCPAIIRLILIRYPDLVPHLIPSTRRGS